MKLSAGTWHKQIPKDPIANVQLRKKFYEATAKDAGLRAGFRQIFQHDLLAYINLCVWQFNPLKKTGKIGPFITWDFQERALLGERGILWAYERDRTTVVEKSREMGASWLFLIFQDWLALFHEHIEALNISKSADAVDSKSMNSLFPKLRFMHKYLPPWLRGEVDDSKMYLGFQTGAEITGEASTGRAGVGGRASVIFVDEFSQIKEDVEVRQRTASTSDCRFFNGTHVGLGTEFYRLTREPEINKIVMHWSEHPEKKKGLYRVVDGVVDVLDKQYAYPKDFDFVLDGTPTGGPYPGLRSPWYDAKCKDIGSSRGVAMELDIDPAGSVAQVFDPLLIHGLIREYCCAPYWEGELDHDKETGRPRKLVERQGGKLRLWINPRADHRPPPGRYGAGADIATGVGATPSCVSFASADTGEKVAEYADANIDPADFASLCVALCWLFKDEDGNGARLCWEARGPGENFGQRIMGLGYRNVYYRTPEVSGLVLAAATTPGWVNTPNNLQFTIGQYHKSLKERQYLNRSKAALLECLLFKFDPTGKVVHGEMESKNDPSGARVNHADRVIADALCWKMVDDLGMVSVVQPVPTIPLLSLEWRRRWHEERLREQDAI